MPQIAGQNVEFHQLKIPPVEPENLRSPYFRPLSKVESTLHHRLTSEQVKPGNLHIVWVDFLSAGVQSLDRYYNEPISLGMDDHTTATGEPFLSAYLPDYKSLIIDTNACQDQSKIMQGITKKILSTIFLKNTTKQSNWNPSVSILMAARFLRFRIFMTK
ncbi:MAG: hypothetical protein R3A45_01865 [Bdellovibrionota bacterium]